MPGLLTRRIRTIEAVERHGVLNAGRCRALVVFGSRLAVIQRTKEGQGVVGLTKGGFERDRLLVVHPRGLRVEALADGQEAFNPLCGGREAGFAVNSSASVAARTWSRLRRSMVNESR